MSADQTYRTYSFLKTALCDPATLGAGEGLPSPPPERPTFFLFSRDRGTSWTRELRSTMLFCAVLLFPFHRLGCLPEGP